MAMDYSKLRGRIVEKFGSMRAFSTALGTQVQQVSRKINSDVGFTKEDIFRWCELLDIQTEEIGIYFFTLKVQENMNTI